MSIFEPFYSLLDILFGWMFSLTGDAKANMVLGIFGVALVISLMINIVNYAILDKEEIKEKKKRLAEYQKKFEEARKKNDTKKLQKLQREMLSLQAEFTKHTMRPALYYMLPILIIFAWLKNFEPLQSYIAMNSGFIVDLPFQFPFWKILRMGRADALGWFGWYILCSISTSTIIRKILKMPI